MPTLLFKGEFNSADYNPQQGFDGCPITWQVSGDEPDPNHLKIADSAIFDRGINYGSRDGSDYAYFWFKETPDDIYGPGDSIEIYSDGEVRLIKEPEQVNKSKRGKFATWE